VALGGYVNEAPRPDRANVVMRVIRPQTGMAVLYVLMHLVHLVRCQQPSHATTSTALVEHSRSPHMDLLCSLYGHVHHCTGTFLIV
jgi:hypothetical protein